MQVHYESGEKQHSRAEQVHGRRDALLWAGAPRDEVTACEQAIGDEGNTKQRVDIALRHSRSMTLRTFRLTPTLSATMDTV